MRRAVATVVLSAITILGDSQQVVALKLFERR